MNKQPQCIIATEHGFKGHMLDVCLSTGYYRMQHLMFTCNDTQADGDGYNIPVFWLRTLLRQCQPQRTALTIQKKCSSFHVSIKRAAINAEVEDLYSLYRGHVPFNTSATCESYLYQPEIPNPFESMMVEVRDGDKLVAIGYFDKGAEAIAGIMNIYHPQYQRYSLGKFLILQKMQYAVLQNMQYYYTGYISTGTTRFDYKTFPDPSAVEVFLPIEKKWVPYNWLGKEFLQDYYFNYLV